MLEINVSKADTQVVETETLTSGRVGLQCKMNFSSEWSGLAKIAEFTGIVSRSVVMNNDTVVVPWECFADAAGYPFFVSVRGARQDGTVVIPSVSAKLGKIMQGSNPTAQRGVEPTPDIVSRIQQDAANAISIARNVERLADSGEFDGRDGADGLDGHSPYIGENGHWYTWDDSSGEYIDTYVPASGGGGGTTDHSQLTNRDTNNQHPISAITGLASALDNNVVKNTGTKTFPIASLDQMRLVVSNSGTPNEVVKISAEGNMAFPTVLFKPVSGNGNTVLSRIAAPVANTDAANKAYVDDSIPTELADLSGDSTHRTVTDAEKTTWSGKQAALVSGTNIKTINNQSLLGSGNITISSGGGDKGLFYVNGVISSTFTSAFTPSAFPYGVPGNVNDLVLDTKGSIGRVSSITSTHIELQMLVEGAYTKDEVDALLEDKISTDMTATASGLSAGSTPTVSYDAETNVLSFGIPAGATGAQGATGAAGADGHSPVVTATKSGTVTTIKVDGTAIATINDGADGADGEDGADGHTPVKGTDYWTAADKQGIVNDVLDALPTWTGGSY